MTDCFDNKHPDHTMEINRLNRVKGQIDGVKKMIEDNRYCPDIITQIRASYKALKAVEVGILEKHFHACVKESFESKNKREIDKKVSELIDIFKKHS